METNNATNDVMNEIAKQNAIYPASIRTKLTTEMNALTRTESKRMITVGDIINKTVSTLIDEVEKKFVEDPDLNKTTRMQYLINGVMMSIGAILRGGVISPITGCDEEWEDTTVPEDIGQKFKFTYRGKEFEIPIESVQVNVRYPKIYRLNNDNNLAHRLDFFQFHEASRPEHVHLTADSIRFIKFPYTMESIHSTCVVNENTITDYLDYNYTDIANGLVYPNQESDDPMGYVIAPKIPFSMLEEAGIDVDAEVEAYLQSIKDCEDIGIDDDDDEDDDI